MDNNLQNLIEEVAIAAIETPESLITQLKINDVLDIIGEMNDPEKYLQYILKLLLTLSIITLSPEVYSNYTTITKRVLVLLSTYKFIDNECEEKKEKDYYDPNMANALPPLNEISTNVHKSGDIVHFIERRYIDATGRKFVAIDVPNYDPQTALLQYRLHEQLQSE